MRVQWGVFDNRDILLLLDDSCTYYRKSYL